MNKILGFLCIIIFFCTALGAIAIYYLLLGQPFGLVFVKPETFDYSQSFYESFLCRKLGFAVPLLGIIGGIIGASLPDRKDEKETNEK